MRSPAEHYIRYRLVKEANRPLQDIEEDLRRELVYPPHKDYTQRLRDEMQIPKVFEPLKLSNVVTQAFLRRYGIKSMWHPNRGTLEAVDVFSRRRPRSLLQSLIAGPFPDNAILELFIRKGKMPLSDKGLDEFRHYFWNVQLLNAQELASYVSAFLKDPILLAVTSVPDTPDGMLFALDKVGVVPNIVDEEAVYHACQTRFNLDMAGVGLTMKHGLARSTSLSLGIKGIHEAGQAIREIKAEKGEDLDEARRYDPQTRIFPFPDLKQLGDGMVPLPVGLLNIEDEPDKEEGTGGAP